jgi:hypothetical protein
VRKGTEPLSAFRLEEGGKESARRATNAKKLCTMEIWKSCHNRNNSLFVGNPRGGRTAAILASTCRRHLIDPQLYLTQLLTNLPKTPISELPNWLPDNWKRRQDPTLAAWKN